MQVIRSYGRVKSCILLIVYFRWSLGLIFWEVFSLARKTPYVGLNKEDHKQAIRDGMRPAKPALAHFSL